MMFSGYSFSGERNSSFLHLCSVSLSVCKSQLPYLKKGLVLGVHEPCGDENFRLSEAGEQFNIQSQGGVLERFRERMKKGQVEITHDLGGYYAVAVVCMGPHNAGFVEAERRNECRENIRVAAAKGLQILTKQECCSVCIDTMGCADAAAEGVKLANWIYHEMKNPPKTDQPEIHMFSANPEKDKDNWEQGCIMADAQNTARYLTDVPANLMTPKRFAEETIRILCPCGVHVTVRPLQWIEEQRMFAFLNMAKGSCQMPFFVEINYCGGSESDRPVVLVGKGVTFDSGGLCLKRCLRETYRHGDMLESKAANSGASVVVGTIKALARLRVPVNVTGLLPLFENMPSGGAIKPGDIVMAMDGKTIVVDDTDNEGRMAVADALVYSDNFKPCLDVVVGNFTMGARKALGSGATPIFSTSQVVWNELEKASGVTGDRVWRFPLWKRFIQRTAMCPHVDVCNTGRGNPDAAPCLNAAFLSKFVPGCDFLSLDNSGTGMFTKGTTAPYLRRSFATGRPTRTMAQFIYNMACPLDPAVPCV